MSTEPEYLELLHSLTRFLMWFSNVIFLMCVKLSYSRFCFDYFCNFVKSSEKMSHPLPDLLQLICSKHMAWCKTCIPLFLFFMFVWLKFFCELQYTNKLLIYLSIKHHPTKRKKFRSRAFGRPTLWQTCTSAFNYEDMDSIFPFPTKWRMLNYTI